MCRMRNSFHERMFRAYTCIAKHQETGVTPTSYPIFLHKDPPFELLGVGLVIVAFSLVIIGVLIFVTHRHKYSSRSVHQPCAGPSNREVPRDFVSFTENDRPLPIPEVQENICMMMRRSWYHKVIRNSRSLQTFVDDNLYFRKPVRLSLSLQTSIQLSHTIGKRAKCDKSLSQMRCSKKDSLSTLEGLAYGIKLEELYSKVRKHKKISNDEQNTGARSLSLYNIRPQSFNQQSQEDPYSTIDETNCPVYDYVRANEHEKNVREDHSKTEAENYHYDYATLPPL